MSMSDEAIARVAHLVNKAFCEACGDYSQPSWEDISDWQKSSAMNSVLYLRNHPEATPESLHNEWMRDKQESGWSYGPVKDAGKKEHPALLPFSGLSRQEQAKDAIFQALVRALDSGCAPEKELS